jgi:hypothetical protein
MLASYSLSIALFADQEASGPALRFCYGPGVRPAGPARNLREITHLGDALRFLVCYGRDCNKWIMLWNMDFEGMW